MKRIIYVKKRRDETKKWCEKKTNRTSSHNLPHRVLPSQKWRNTRNIFTTDEKKNGRPSTPSRPAGQKWRNTRNIRVRDEKVQQREQEPRVEVTRFAGWRPAWWLLIRELRNIELLLNIQENAAHKYGGKKHTKHCCTYVPPRPERLLHMCSA